MPMGPRKYAIILLVHMLPPGARVVWLVVQARGCIYHKCSHYNYVLYITDHAWVNSWWSGGTVHVTTAYCH